MNTVEQWLIEDDDYVDTGRYFEQHAFNPAVSEDLCLHRMGEGYICAAPKQSPLHQPKPDGAL